MSKYLYLHDNGDIGQTTKSPSTADLIDIEFGRLRIITLEDDEFHFLTPGSVTEPVEDQENF